MANSLDITLAFFGVASVIGMFIFGSLNPKLKRVKVNKGDANKKL